MMGRKRPFRHRPWVHAGSIRVSLARGTKMTQPEAIPALPRIHRLKLYYEQHEAKLAIAFFVGGFLFDILTLGRVDSWLTIGQEILYLVVITTALMQIFFDQGRPPPALEKMFVVKRWYY